MSNKNFTKPLIEPEENNQQPDQTYDLQDDFTNNKNSDREEDFDAIRSTN